VEPVGVIRGELNCGGGPGKRLRLKTLSQAEGEKGQMKSFVHFILEPLAFSLYLRLSS